LNVKRSKRERGNSNKVRLEECLNKAFGSRLLKPRHAMRHRVKESRLRPPLTASDPTTAWRLETLADCTLAIAGFPRFSYDGRGGSGLGTLSAGVLRFDPKTLAIPSLDWRSTRVLGLPLPPGVTIGIHTTALAGSFDPVSGQLDLQFSAVFRFSLSGLYRAPDLHVDTSLSSSGVESQRHRISGRPLTPDGEGQLVGVALVPPTGDRWLDRFLGLPDEALAILRCRLTPQQSCRVSSS
jgi:hypothetical protein